MENIKLKLAVQKKGRLSDKSLQLLRNCGLEIENYSERLFLPARNFDLDLLFLRDDDIPEYVQDGVADVGIVGENVLYEKSANVEIIKKLGFGKCKLMIGIPESSNLDSVDELNGKKIATSHPKILRDYLQRNSVSSKIIDISGSVEIAPSLGIADFICDIVSTGNTLRFNKLKKSFNVFDSEAVLVGNKDLSADKTKWDLLNNLQRRIDSVLAAKKSKYLMMNIPKNSLEKISQIIPSLSSPTVLHLADTNMLAVHAVIPTDKFWEIIDDLKNEGASGILLLPIENLVP